MDPYDFPIEFQGIQGFNFADMDILNKVESAISKIISKKGNKYIETKYFKRRELKSAEDMKINDSFIPQLTKRILGEKKVVKELSLNEEKALDNGYNFLSKKLFDAAVVQFNNILRKNDTNYKAHYGRFLAKLHINEKYFTDLNKTGYSPSVPEEVDFHDIEAALDYAPTKQIAKIILDQSVLVFKHMQYWETSTRYKYKIVTEFFKLLISYLDEKQSQELKEALWDDFEFINEKDIYYTENLMLVHQATILLTTDKSPELYIKETTQLVNMLISQGEFKKAVELNNHLLRIDSFDSKLLFNQARITLKSKSDKDLLETIIWERKLKALETLITRAKNPKESVVRILDALKVVNIMYYVKHYKRIAKIIDTSISYLPNFDEKMFVEELIYFGNAHLEMSMFKESKRYFSEVLEINGNNVDALWGIVKANAKCPRDIDLIDNKINLIKFQEYNQLINSPEETEYFTDIYHHIQMGVMKDDRILEISQKTVGFEERLLQYKQKH